MGMNVGDLGGGGGNIEEFPTGMHLGYLYRIIDLGNKDHTYQGETQNKRQAFFQFLVPGVTMEDKEGKEMPRTIASFITLTKGERGNLWKRICKPWSGGKLTHSAFCNMDLDKLVGKWGLINVGTHDTNGKSIIENINPLMDGQSAGEYPEGYEPASWYIGALTSDPASIPEWITKGIRKMILECDQARNLGLAPEGEDPGVAAVKGGFGGTEIDEGDIPF